MKHTVTRLLAFLLAAVCLMGLVSCGGQKKSEFGNPATAIMPQYLGEGEDDPFYQFTAADLKVTVIYSDSLTAELTEDYKITTTTEEGYFIIEVSWNGLNGDIMIPIGKEKYQNYKADLDARRAELEESMAAEAEAAEKAAE